MSIFRQFITAALLLAAFRPLAGAEKNDIGTLLTKAAAAGEFSGVVLIAKGDRVIYQGAVGQADRSWNIPNDSKTRFRICSVTKQFTALLIMQLVEAGKVKLDAPITDYLADFRRETGAKITVRDLLHSASGLPQLPDEFYVSEDPHLTDASYVAGKYLQGDLLFPPGEKFSYNNADFILLGAIIERVTGKSYGDNLRTKVLAPLGMTNSGLVRNEDVIDRMARGYTYKNGWYAQDGLVVIENFGSAGAMYSTVEDLLLWDRALLQHKLLSSKSTEEMFRPSPKLGFVALGSWTYSAELADGKTHLLTERQGNINGYCALNIISRADGLVAIFLDNTETQTLFSTYAGKGLSFQVLNAAYAESATGPKATPKP